jgi:diadenosine tetraphosphate (Ap4A) HIT family hydrolase
MSTTCPFCARIAKGELDARTSLAAAFGDGYPVSPGHTLIVPVRHVASLFELDSTEIAQVWDQLVQAKTRLEKERHIDGWNIGTNIAEAGGQTVGHAHVHLIPRYRGDVPDPRGGVRHCIPGRGSYEPTS